MLVPPRGAVSVIASLFICIGGGEAIAQNPPLRLVTDVIHTTPSAEIGGDNVEPAVPGQWPATLFPRFDAEKCTITLVGPMVALTAAHCTQNEGVHPLDIDGAGARSMTCHWDLQSKFRPAPKYPPPDWPAEQRAAASFDYALCKIDREITGIVFERIAKPSEVQLRLSDVVTILGFGCTDLETMRGYGTLRLARSRIKRLPGANGDNYFEIADYSTSGSYYCNGDSGGAVYWLTGPGTTQRAIVGVNSAVVVTAIGGVKQIAGPSYSASLLSPTAKKFIESWEARGADHHICGYSSKHPACRKS